MILAGGPNEIKKSSRTIGVAIALTVFNILVGIIGIVGWVNTAENNRAINAIGTNFTYYDDSSAVQLKLNNCETVTLRFGENSVRVEQSFLWNGKEQIMEIIMFIRNYAQAHGYKIERAVTDLYGEYKLHNFLYAMGYKRESTGSCDLDYISDRRWYVNLVSKIWGLVGI